MNRAGGDIVIKNKKASHFYEFLDKYIAGIKLTGTEIKSIRLGKASIVDTYCFFSNGELFLKGMHIAEYWWGNLNNHDPLRDRKLLLTKKELRKIERKTKETGLTIIATKVFINERGLAKAEIAVARGKKEFDKRESLKHEDASREMDRIKKMKARF
jgi:SsrA-binding protein